MELKIGNRNQKNRDLLIQGFQGQFDNVQQLIDNFHFIIDIFQKLIDKLQYN